MDWRDEAILLSIEVYGERDVLIDVMTKEHGRCRGFVLGGNSRSQRPIFQAGNALALDWRSRVSENLGRFTVELISSPLGGLLSRPGPLLSLSALTGLMSASLPEREADPALYQGLKALIAYIEDRTDDMSLIAAQLVRFELGLLSSLGYGLDLTCCAATNGVSDLVYVSPKSGRAVSREAGAPYHNKLLSLPDFLNPHAKARPEIDQARDKQVACETDGAFMANMNGIDPAEILDGFILTGFFLTRYVWSLRKSEPSARARFIEYFQKRYAFL